MAPSSARPPGFDPTYTALKHKLNVLRDEVASALEQARSTGFAEDPKWDLATVRQAAAYTDLHDEYWDMVIAAKIILSDLFIEHTGMLTRNASRPQSSTLVQQQRQASKSSPQHAFETQLESKALQPGRPNASLGPAIFREKAAREAAEQTRKSSPQHAFETQLESKALQPGRPNASLGPAIFREKAAREEAERARKQAEQQAKQAKQVAEQQTKQSSEHQAVHVSKPEASKQPPRKPIGPEILTRLAFKARGDSQTGPPEKTTLAGSGQLSQMPQRGLNDKPSDQVIPEFQARQKFMQDKRAHQVEELEDVHPSKSTSDANELSSKDVQQQLELLDGENNLVKDLKELTDQSRGIISEQKERIAALEEELEMQRAVSREFERVVEGFMAVGL